MRSPWLDFFGLRSNPFADTIDPDFFFRTRQHEEAAVRVRIGIEERHALILLCGPSGTGKTLVAQVALKGLAAESFEPVFVFVHPGMGKGALLDAVIGELGGPRGRTTHEKIARIQDRALALHGEGRRLVAVIDEAHFLSADALHVLRTLSNLETEKEKLVTVLLIAEEGLRRRLKAPAYAALRGRITFVVPLSPLAAGDLEQYVKYRLLKGGANGNLLAPDVYETVFSLTAGIPREVNRLLCNAFLDSLAAGQRGVDRGRILGAAARL